MCRMISFVLSATPRPPLNFRVGLENGQFTVRWGERTSWKVSPVIKRLYTVAYYPSSKKLKVCCLICDHQTRTNNNIGRNSITVYCKRPCISHIHR